MLCDALDEVVEGTTRNLMVFMPPGSAKSTYGSVRFPAYLLGRKPTEDIICAAYSGDLAKSFGRKVRNVIPTREYQTIFPGTALAEDSQAKGEWETSQGGSYLAAGVDGAITGRRAGLGVIDDPVKGRHEADSDTVKRATWAWYLSDFLSRLKPDAAQVLIQTRWTQDDLAGRILPEDWDGESGTFEGRDGKTWKVICLQAEAEEGKNDPLGRAPGGWLWPEWFTAKYWDETKRTQLATDVRNWSALYQQRPTPEDGDYFRRDNFRWYDKPPKHRNILITHDNGVTDDGDPTEIGVWGIDPNDDIYLLHGWGGRVTSDVWVDQLIDLIDKYDPFVVAGESGPIRRSVEPFLVKRMNQRKVFARLEWLPTIGDKSARARAFQALTSMGKVYLPSGDQYAEDFLSELLRFPAGALDNKVDMAGLLGRAINQTWAPKKPKRASKAKITKRMTLAELLERHDRKPKPKRARI